MNRFVLVVALVLMGGVASASEYVPDFAQSFVPKEEKDLSDRERAAAEFARKIVKDMNPEGVLAKNPQVINPALELQQRGKDLVNAELLKEKDAALRLLGIDPNQKGKLYIFVSSSMSDELIFSYTRDALWTGATLLVKGVPPGMSLSDFLKKRVSEWVRNKGATAAVDIDPRLFDLFQVTVAPTIVYSESEEPLSNPACTLRQEEWSGVPLKSCDEADPSTYWKMEGAVTLVWALDEMIKQGAVGAQRYRDALSRSGVKAGEVVQRPFSGDWKALPTPDELREMNGILAAGGSQAYTTPEGYTAIGAPGLDLSQQRLVPPQP